MVPQAEQAFAQQDQAIADMNRASSGGGLARGRSEFGGLVIGCIEAIFATKY